MPIKLAAETGPRMSGLGWAIVGGFGAVAVAAIALSVTNGPQVRAAAQAAIEQENRAICTKLGLGPETGRFSECAAALSDVRTNYARRNEQSIL